MEEVDLARPNYKEANTTHYKTGDHMEPSGDHMEPSGDHMEPSGRKGKAKKNLMQSSGRKQRWQNQDADRWKQLEMQYHNVRF